MHRHLVPPVSPRLAAFAWLLALGLLAPAGLGAQTHPMEDMRQAAADRVWVRQYLRLYDQVLSMQAALGMMTGQEADARLAAAGRELHQQGFHDADMDAVRDALRATAAPFLDSVESEIESSTAWAADMPAEVYRSLAGRLLRFARSELDRSLARGADPVDALRAATFILALARGHEAIPAEIDYFAGSAARAAGSVPAIELMPMDAAAPTVPAAGSRGGRRGRLAGPHARQPGAGSGRGRCPADRTLRVRRLRRARRPPRGGRPAGHRDRALDPGPRVRGRDDRDPQ